MIHSLQVANSDYIEVTKHPTQDDEHLYTKAAIIQLNKIHEQAQVDKNAKTLTQNIKSTSKKNQKYLL